MAARRRGGGEGSVRKRADGRWEATISLGEREVDGRRRRIRRSVYGRTRREATEKLARLRRELEDGLRIDAPERLTLGQWFDAWLADAEGRIRASTAGTYAWLGRCHVKPYVGSVPLRAFTPSVARDHQRRLQGADASAHVRRQVHVLLKTVLAAAVRDGLLARNPLDAVRAPTRPPKELRTLTADEVRRLLDTARDHPRLSRYEALFALAVGTGLRLGEILGLRWGDLDVSRRTLQVRRQLGRDRTLVETKTKRSRRQVFLPVFAVAALRRHRRRLGAVPHPEKLVFTDVLGGPIRRENFRKREWKALLNAAGLPNVRFHDLRHTAATLMLEGGLHPKVVQERLGHASITLTLDTYSHVAPSMDRDAADAMDDLLRPRRR